MYNNTLVRVYGNIGMFSKAMGKFREMETCGIKINSKLQCNDWGIWKTTSILWLKNYLMTWKQDTKSYIIKYFIFYSFGIMINQKEKEERIKVKWGVCLAFANQKKKYPTQISLKAY